MDFGLIDSELDPLYPLYVSEREPLDAVVQRGRMFLEFVAGRSETNILVVTHSAFLKVFFLNGK